MADVNWDDFKPVESSGGIDWDSFTPVENEKPDVVTSARAWNGAGGGRGKGDQSRRIDAQQQEAPAAGGGRGFVNPDTVTADRSFGDAAGDVAIAAAKGAVALPQAAVGLLDIATLGKAGKFLESIGYRPEDAKTFLDQYLSDAQRQANERLQNAEGFSDTVKTALSNPSVVAMSAIESLPQMMAGGLVGRGALAASSKVAPWAAGAIGEGVVGAGQSASDIRSKTADGELTLKQAASALASGAIDSVIGAVGGKAAHKLGLPDVDTMLATGKLSQNKVGFVKALVGSGISEGVFEEMPQSAQEQMWQNYALGKPIMEGVGNAAGMGLVTGAAMGMAGGGSSAAMNGNPAASALSDALSGEFAPLGKEDVHLANLNPNLSPEAPRPIVLAPTATVTDVLAAGSVDGAIATANAATSTIDPQALQQNLAEQARQAATNLAQDVANGTTAAVQPGDAGATGQRGADALPSLDAVLGESGVPGGAVVGEGNASGMADEAVRVGAENQPLNYKHTVNPDGTVTVYGDPAKIKADFGGERLMPVKGGEGVTFGKSRSGEVLQRLGATPSSIDGEAILSESDAKQRQSEVAGSEVIKVDDGYAVAPAQPRETVGDLRKQQLAVSKLNDDIAATGGPNVSVERFEDDGSGVETPRGLASRAVDLVGRVSKLAFGWSPIKVTGLNAFGAQHRGNVFVDIDTIAESGDGKEMVSTIAIHAIGHENTHQLEKSKDPEDQKAYQGLREVALKYARDGVVERRRQIEEQASGKQETQATAESEFVADVGGSMWMDPKFWGMLHDLDDGSIARRVAYRFMQAATKFIKVAKGSRFDIDALVKDVEAVRKAYAQAFADKAKRGDSAKQQTKAEAPEAPSMSIDDIDDLGAFNLDNIDDSNEESFDDLPPDLNWGRMGLRDSSGNRSMAADNGYAIIENSDGEYEVYDPDGSEIGRAYTLQDAKDRAQRDSDNTHRAGAEMRRENARREQEAARAREEVARRDREMRAASAVAEPTADEIKENGLHPERAISIQAVDERDGSVRFVTPSFVKLRGSVEVSPQGDKYYAGTRIQTGSTFPTTGYLTKDGAIAYVQRQIAAVHLYNIDYDLASIYRKGTVLKVASKWQALAKLSKAFQNNNQSKSLDFVSIANDLGLLQEYKISAEQSGYYVTLSFEHKTTGRSFNASIGETVRDERVGIECCTMGLNGSDIGRSFYTIAANYAKNIGKPFFADMTLSSVNSYRRTEQALSFALKTGDSGILLPGLQNRVYGYNDTPKTKEDHAKNIARLALANLRNVEELIPEVRRWKYDGKTDTFTDSRGNSIEDKIDQIVGNKAKNAKGENDVRVFGIGRSTLARAVLTSQIIANDPAIDAIDEFAEPVLYSVANVDDMTSSESYGDPAPAGEKKASLNPKFEKWFGKSKVVDANGNPLVVYHGTAADMTFFDTLALGASTGARSAKGGFFFAASPKVASGYAMLSGTRPALRNAIYKNAASSEVLSPDLKQMLLDAADHYTDEDVENSKWIDQAGGGVTGANVLPVYLSLKNPLVVDYGGLEYREQKFSDVVYEAKSNGHDGVVFKNAEDSAHKSYAEPTDIYVVFSPTQIKSVFNNGEFDPENPDISLSRAYTGADYKQALEKKFERMRRFHDSYDNLFAQIDRDADKGVEEASILRLIARTGFRIGGDPNLVEGKEAYGASTLKPSHVTIKGDTVSFDFIGKAGVRQRHSITDPKIARDLEARMGREQLFSKADRAVRKYLDKLDGAQDFKVHDFRTWNATNAAMKVVEALPLPRNAAEYRGGVELAGSVAATKIGDTLGVTLESYVDPEIFKEWREAAGIKDEPAVQKGSGAREAEGNAAGDTRGADESNEQALSKEDVSYSRTEYQPKEDASVTRWAQSILNSRGNISESKILSKKIPHESMTLGPGTPFGRDQIVVLDGHALDHAKKHVKDGITAQMIGMLPDAMKHPRMVTFQAPGQALVMLPIRAADGSPLVVSLKKDAISGGGQTLKVTRFATTYPLNNSAAYVVREMKKGNRMWLPSEEVSRLRGLLGRLDATQGPGEPGILTQTLALPASRGRNQVAKEFSVLSDQALVNKKGGDKDWLKATESISIPDDAEKRLGSVAFSRKIIGDTGRKYTPQQLAAFDNVGFRTQPTTLKEKVKALWADAGRITAQGIADQFAPIEDIDKKAYALMRLSKGSAGAFETVLHGGMLKLTDGAYDFDAERKGGFIERVLIPLQGEHHDFLRWVAANRAERLMAEDREHLFTAEDIAAIKSLADGKADFDYEIQHGARKGQITRDRTLIYADTLKTFVEFQKNVLDMAEQSGLIDKDSRAIWEHEFYVPFYRSTTPDDPFIGPSIKKGSVRQEAFKTLKGGKDKLNTDLLDNTLMNWAHLIDAAAKNRAALAALEAAQDMGVATEAPESLAKELAKASGNKQGHVWVMDSGAKRHFVVGDKYVLHALLGLQFTGLRGPIMDALSTAKHWLTVGVTASPFFKVKNLIRDSIQAVSVSGLSYNVPKNVYQGWKASSRESDQHFRMLASGGTIHFATMYEGSESRRVQALVESGVDHNTILNDPAKVKLFYRKVVEPVITAYNELGNRGEEINRAALYKQLVAQGVSHRDAALQARDLMDFSMQGTWTTVRFLSQVVPFLNARIQGLYKLGKGAKEDPRKFIATAGAVALASLALLAAYHDDEDWKKREEWDRNNYWWFKFGGKAYRIPKPFEIGAMATLAERGAELWFDKEMTGKRFADQVWTLLGDNLSMNPIPQLVKPILDLYSNKDSFTGRPIENAAMEKLDPKYRYNKDTTMLARAASSAMSTATFGKAALSPLQIDHLVYGYFSWLGSFIVAAPDIALRPALNEPSKPTPDYWKAWTGNMISDKDSGTSRYVTSMYDQAKELEQAYATHRMLLKQGKVEDARAYQQDHKDELQRYGRVENVKKGVASIQEQIRIIERSNKSADEKRDRIKVLKERQDKLAKTLAPQ